jgi:hypothetical protein
LPYETPESYRKNFREKIRRRVAGIAGEFRLMKVKEVEVGAQRGHSNQ